MARKLTQYRVVDTSTLKGQRTAERLHANGWETIRVGLFILTMRKRPA